MASGSQTFFTNDSGAAGGANQFVIDAFQDISLTATNNTGLNATVSSNPLNGLWANDDSPRLGPKTLYIKDLVLIQERYKWVNGEPTYQIIWNETFPQVMGYIWGSIQIIRNFDQTFVRIKSIGDGFGITGIMRRVMFLMNRDTASTATGTIQVDGAGSTTIDYSNLAPDSDNNSRVNRYAAFVHAAANETLDLHDFRLKANEPGTLEIVGVVAYFENSGANVEFRPGTTYNNKTRAATTVGASLPIPSIGSSLGGTSVLYKTASGTYTQSSVAATMLQTTVTGSASATSATVTTNTGASFPAGTGFVAKNGSSFMVGIVQSVSTDTLTVAPALPFGLSGGILYKSFYAGQSLPINASLMALAGTWGFTQSNFQGFTCSYVDPYGQFAVWGQNVGMTMIDGVNPAIAWAGPSGFLQVDGYFSAAEIEWTGMSIAVLSGTMTVNGLGAYSHANIGATGIMKKTVFTDAGPGWNSFAFFPGGSHLNCGVSRINLYRRDYDRSPTFGLLANFDTLQTFVDRGAVNATLMAPGVYRRYYADQLGFIGASSWTRGITTAAAGGIRYTGVSTPTGLRFEYWGQNFSIIGIASSLAIMLDGVGVTASQCFNVMKAVASEGFHVIGVSLLGPSTSIDAIDITRSRGELSSIQRFSAITTQSPTASTYVGARYVCTSQANISNVPVQYNLKTFDTHNAVTIGVTWRFTAPMPGKYEVIARATSASGFSSGYQNFSLYKNGIIYSTQYTNNSGVVNSYLLLSDSIPMSSGDYIHVECDNGGTLLLQANSTDSVINIKRLGD